MRSEIVVQEYKRMIDDGIIAPTLRCMNPVLATTCWLSNCVFVWHGGTRTNLTVTLKPYDTLNNEDYFCFDIKHNEIRIRTRLGSGAQHTVIQHISTEEEYFQVSTVEKLEFPLETYIHLRTLFDAVAEKFCEE